MMNILISVEMCLIVCWFNATLVLSPLLPPNLIYVLIIFLILFSQNLPYRDPWHFKFQISCPVSVAMLFKKIIRGSSKPRVTIRITHSPPPRWVIVKVPLNLPSWTTAPCRLFAGNLHIWGFFPTSENIPLNLRTMTESTYSVTNIILLFSISWRNSMLTKRTEVRGIRVRERNIQSGSFSSDSAMRRRSTAMSNKIRISVTVFHVVHKWTRNRQDMCVRLGFPLLRLQTT